MKIIFHLLFILLTASVNGEEIYIGSTPGNSIVKTFLGIPLSDSLDFIRWKLMIQDDSYSLHCDYGRSKPNTDGFAEPKTIDIKGKVIKEGNYYHLQNNNKMILLAIFNAHVLHFADADKSLLPGDGGWSYTLSSAGTNMPIDIKPKQIALKDSMVFQGRTPCPEIAKLGLQLSENCYKIKWWLVLYSSNGKPTTYNAWRHIQPGTGTWKINNGMIILGSGEHPVYFIMPDENIILFTDAKGNLLQGNKDFGYTLNQKY
jgi:hypothetical protein